MCNRSEFNNDRESDDASDHSEPEESTSSAAAAVSSTTITATILPSQGDIGSVVTVVSNLTDQEKYRLLTDPFHPNRFYQFPCIKDSSGKNRFFKYDWLEKYPGLVYSPIAKGGFCKYCVLFTKTDSSASTLGILVSRPLTSGRKATEILQNHFFGKDGKGKLTHAQAVIDAEYFKQYIEGQSNPIEKLCDDLSSKQIKENRLKLESILKVIILCGRQNMPLRGHRDDSGSISTNKGNFLALIDFRCEAGDTILKEHLKSSSSRATYISKTIQNDLIMACGEYIRDMILEEVQSCRFFSIIADEATDSSNREQLSIVLRFVDDKMDVREEFMGFVECKTGVTGEALAGTILDILDEWKLDKQNLCGQAYDGAGSMAGATKGVAARISQQYPKACYVHCASHVLNLCIVQSASVPDIRNMMDVASGVARFFNNSPKRQMALDKYIEDLHSRDSQSSKRKKLKELCQTRWVERHDAFEAFSELFESTV